MKVYISGNKNFVEKYHQKTLTNNILTTLDILTEKKANEQIIHLGTVRKSFLLFQETGSIMDVLLKPSKKIL